MTVVLLATLMSLAAASGLCLYAGRECGQRIEFLRAHVFLIAAACVLGAFLLNDRSFVYAVIVAVCAVSAVSDVQTGYIFDAVVAPAIAILLTVSMLHGTIGVYAAGAAVAGGVPLILFLITRGSGIGFGDVKLGCCIGAMGAVPALRALEAAFIAGGVVAIVLILRRGRDARGMEIPFAPFLFGGVLYSALTSGSTL